jgi:hypothetical protein
MRSKIWTVSEIDFKNIVKSSNSIGEALTQIGIPNGGSSNYKYFIKRVQELKIDISHFNPTMGKRNGSKPLNTYLVKSSTLNRTSIKRRLIKEGLIEYRCDQCKNEGVWNNKQLILQLEHKNGIPDDNRLENLCFLCPNCHSQTDTFAGKQLKKSEADKKKHYCSCGNRVSSSCVQKCLSCASLAKRRVIRPDINTLKKELENSTYVAMGKKYGVSDVTIKKWSNNISFVKEDPRP